MNARLTGGLAAAVLLGAGLVCPGAATAADPTGYPYHLDFQPTVLVTSGDDVFAAGLDENHVGHVAELGGDSTVVAENMYSIDMVVDPTSDSLRVLGVLDESMGFWDVDTADMTVEYLDDTWGDVQLGVDSVGPYAFQGRTLQVPGQPDVAIDIAGDVAAYVTATAARGPSGERTWFAGGYRWTTDNHYVASLWRFDEGSEVQATPLALGAAGDPDAYVSDVVADPAHGVTYALSFSEHDEGPNTYGLNVIDDGEDPIYVPLPGSATQLALSADGHKLFVAGSTGVLAIPTLEDFDKDADGRFLSLEGDNVNSLATDADGNLLVGGDSDVYAFGAPDAPYDLVAEPDAMSTSQINVAWGEGKYAWELGDEELLGYRYTVRSGTDVVASDTVFDQRVHLEALTPGTTYTVEVTASNDLFDSEPATTEVTTYNRYVSAPSAIAVKGSLVVGSQLSLAATTGSWEAGTTLSYEWYGSNGEMGGAIGAGPTLTLTAEHLGMTITGVVTGTKTGAAGVTLDARPAGVVSNPTVVKPPAAKPHKLKAPKPVVAGKAKVGKTLTAKAGSWTAGTKLTYTWSANGKAIKGAHKPKLKLGKALRGKKISVEVTGKKAGYTTVTKESAQTGKVKR